MVDVVDGVDEVVEVVDEVDDGTGVRGGLVTFAERGPVAGGVERLGRARHGDAAEDRHRGDSGDDCRAVPDVGRGTTTTDPGGRRRERPAATG